MKQLVAVTALLAIVGVAHAQSKTDKWLEQLIRGQASPFLKEVLNQPDTFHYQLIYTKIDRDKHNKPHFTNYYFRVNCDEYFNPASMVKLPTALLALEKINTLSKYGVTKYTTMLTDSAFSRQKKVKYDSSAANYLPSVAQYVKKVFLVSDNDAYNR